MTTEEKQDMIQSQVKMLLKLGYNEDFIGEAVAELQDVIYKIELVGKIKF